MIEFADVKFEVIERHTKAGVYQLMVGIGKVHIKDIVVLNGQKVSE